MVFGILILTRLFLFFHSSARKFALLVTTMVAYGTAQSQVLNLSRSMIKNFVHAHFRTNSSGGDATYATDYGKTAQHRLLSYR